MTNNKYSNPNNINRSNQQSQSNNQNSRGHKALDTRAKNENKSVHQVASEMGSKGGQNSPGNKNQNHK